VTETKRPEYSEVLTPEELAQYLKCGRTYAYQLLANEAIPSFKLGRLRRIRRQDAERFLERAVDESGQ
jgi:excisionase family DNA binding protein